MATIFRPATEADVLPITELVNRYAAQNLMLPRTEESVRQTLADWLAAAEDRPGAGTPPILGCGALIPLTDTLVEVRSLAVDESQQGKGLGGQIVLYLVQMARELGYHQICALTLREQFFIRLGFKLVDRWTISPKVWQACIYCPKFHRCDEVAVLMDLVENPAGVANPLDRSAGWNSLLKWKEWQPLRLAYKKSLPLEIGAENGK